MPLPALLLHMVCQAAREQGGGRACSAGYPDLLVTRAQLSQLLGPEKAQRVPVREDSDNIIAWHDASKWLDCVFDTASVFRELGYSLDVLDIQAARGGEIIADLNHPLPSGLEHTYDLVVDTGTCEHCFNIGQAAMNLASLVKPGGIIVQGLPLNFYNHGFYNINPTWFFDFYPVNGFEILYMQGVVNATVNPETFDVPMFGRFTDVPDNTSLLMVAKRERVAPPTIPVQYKYRVSPKLGNK